ncbi:hypothetical protein [Microbacterium sp. Marseille-Q6965]|uniref:hypothetical protein n=1 Tax=Microbacterium sp. Marseille-Q6965 TaxID=2965072 RepID=UPI0021B75B48|nr:hypothetical protein [Microbacterium sp. Marseille-Q6965]
MRWERFFQDLENQLAAEWDAKRAALDSESERLRIAGLALRDRLRALVGTDPVAFELVDGSRHEAAIAAVGADWIAGRPPAAGVLIVPLAAVRLIGASEPELLRSARASTGPDLLAARVTLGFALRDLARRRVPATLGLRGGRTATGTLDRVGADHLDLAVHALDAPRRPAEVVGFRLVPLASLAWLRVDADASPVLT